jgi:hypothetical protein
MARIRTRGPNTASNDDLVGIDRLQNRAKHPQQAAGADGVRRQTCPLNPPLS